MTTPAPNTLPLTTAVTAAGGSLHISPGGIAIAIILVLALVAILSPGAWYRLKQICIALIVIAVVVMVIAEGDFISLQAGS